MIHIKKVSFKASGDPAQWSRFPFGNRVTTNRHVFRLTHLCIAGNVIGNDLKLIPHADHEMLPQKQATEAAEQVKLAQSPRTTTSQLYRLLSEGNTLTRID